MSSKEEVLSKIDIVEFVGKSVQLVKSGAKWVGCCPFHGEKTASFHVNPHKQSRWICYGCGKKGDAIDFRMLQRGLSFQDALEELAVEYGVSAPESPRERKHDSLYGVLDQAARYYNWQLNSGELGLQARDYLASRGISIEQANELGIGVAARPFWKKLKDSQVAAAETVGVVHKFADSGNLADFLAERLILPIKDQHGQVVALTGRLAPWTGKEGPKYLNTHESPIFKKGETFFRLNPTAVKEQGFAIIVEGQFDEISMDLGGAPNTTATCGTALTAQHVAKLKKITKHVLFLFDGDEAGQKAALRGIELAIEGGLIPFVSVLPAGEDPDSMTRGQGIEAVRALPMIDGFKFALDRLLNLHVGLGEAEKAAAVTDGIIPLINKYADPVVRDCRINETARGLGVSPEAVHKKMGLLDPLAIRVAALERAMLYAAKTSPEVREVMKKRGEIEDLFEGSVLEEVKQIIF